MVGQQEQLGGLVLGDHLVMKLLEIEYIIVELVDISLLLVGQQPIGQTLAAVVDEVEAVALTPQIPGQLLILEVAFDPTVDDEDGAIDLGLAQGCIADGDPVLALEGARRRADARSRAGSADEGWRRRLPASADRDCSRRGLRQKTGSGPARAGG